MGERQTQWRLYTAQPKTKVCIYLIKEKGGGEKKVGEAAVTYLQGNITYVPVDM